MMILVTWTINNWYGAKNGGNTIEQNLYTESGIDRRDCICEQRAVGTRGMPRID